ncbi:hypothetical protein BKA67DRAFT_551086 [Truncatella angustata]|uniref:Uncharacterized protein n=1 Tax=Truncatella angustata TaxID=152316 RepID=A0A9P9A4C9_9PEZI|nr:uncharacterized protein BKA67DRAFT_551086 [Truncatella angustata]KAH6661397.1 hypothetical protein BKA67DRAFT_551086 [Truncatella angustata]KAH8200258.1 hypothetical protein TruAng_005594 [Truncatella angustata]
MSDHLRVQLAKFKVEHLQHEDENRDVWGYKFAQARAAWLAGIRVPEPHFPIILASDSPISNPEKLQAIVDRHSVPKVTMATKVEMFSDDEVELADREKVQNCDVNYDHVRRIKTITEWENACVFCNGEKIFALLVRSLKKTKM